MEPINFALEIFKTIALSSSPLIVKVMEVFILIISTLIIISLLAFAARLGYLLANKLIH